MARLCSTLALLLFILTSGVSAFAGTIAIDLDPVITVADGHMRVDATLVNKGTVTAHAVRLRATVLDAEVRSGVRVTLAPDESWSVTLDAGPVPVLPGGYPLELRVLYEDSADYPFSNTRVMPVVTTVIEAEPRIDLEAKDIVIRGKGSIDVILELTGTSNKVDALIRLVHPNELTGSDAQALTLSPGIARSMRFDLSTDTALDGSRYEVTIVAEYIHEGQHRMQYGTCVVGIETPPSDVDVAAPPTAVFVLLGLLTMICIAGSCRKDTGDSLNPILGWGLLLTWGTLAHHYIPVDLLFADTMAVGGDTPAHHYLVSHIREHGPAPSWADGWWGGFPAFQFYFALPYSVTALLTSFMPHNIAFKLVSITGVMMLPICTFLSARSLNMPKPGPLLAAILSVPFLFSGVHTMWGVNIYSTLAGMIANSWSFAIMLLAIGCVWQDAVQQRSRARTILLLALTIHSHFFTSIVAALTLAVLPWLRPREDRRSVLRVLAVDGLVAGLLMAWWIIPLLSRMDYSIDFGGSWSLSKVAEGIRGGNLEYMILLLPAAWWSLRCAKRDPKNRSGLLWAWMLGVSTFLFLLGDQIASVFNNIRLWPFIHFAAGMLAADGMARLCSRHRIQPALVAITAVGAVLLVVYPLPGARQNDVAAWSDYNYKGAEAKPAWPAYRDLVLPLDGTPGRLANDLHPDNERMGSSRIFESVPHRIDKNILEGGLVNSGAGALYAYFIQGETSRSSAGAPRIVNAQTFDVERATRHLELMNVKHVIARWPILQGWLEHSPDWTRLKESGPWELFELTTHDGRYVTLLEREPIAVLTEDWKRASLRWMESYDRVDDPVVFLREPDATGRFNNPLSPEAYTDWLSAEAPAPELRKEPGLVVREEINDGRIRFRTTAVGQAHLIKVSYYPNWRITGAKRIYRVSPGFMLVYPEEQDVELVFGPSMADITGRLLSLLGLGMVLMYARRGNKQSSIQPDDKS